MGEEGGGGGRGREGAGKKVYHHVESPREKSGHGEWAEGGQRVGEGGGKLPETIPPWGVCTRFFAYNGIVTDG